MNTNCSILCTIVSMVYTHIMFNTAVYVNTQVHIQSLRQPRAMLEKNTQYLGQQWLYPRHVFYCDFVFTSRYIPVLLHVCTDSGEINLLLQTWKIWPIYCMNPQRTVLFTKHSTKTLCSFVVCTAFRVDVIKREHFPRYWPFVRGIHRSPVNSPHKGQWSGSLMVSLIRACTKSWVNNGDAKNAS